MKRRQFLPPFLTLYIIYYIGLIRLTITTLASGSSGNCILVSHGDTHLLVDCGISCRRIKTALAGLGLSPDELTAILITHEHSDHISGLATLFKHHQIPVWCSKGTGRQLVYRIAFIGEVLHTFEPGEEFTLGGLTVTAFATLHDAADSVGYTFTDGVRRAAIVTDLGVETDVVTDAIAGCDFLLAEANHDPDLLREGPYPFYLKQRILGEHGHLSNAACAAMARRCGARTVVLAHLSAENNRPSLALETVRAGLDADICVEVAPRSETGRRYEV